MHIDAALEKFLAQITADGRSSHTIRQYHRHARLFTTWSFRVGHSGELMDISNETIAEFFASTEATQRADGKPKLQTSLKSLLKNSIDHHGILLL